MSKKDSDFHYTKPQKIDEALHILEGIIKGVSIDGSINSEENSFIQQWFEANEDLVNYPPFTEIVPLLDEAIKDGILDDEEKLDIIWICQNFNTKNLYFSAFTSDMQRLQGMMRGIVADKKIEKAELDGLRVWLDHHKHLRGCYPYDEIDSLIDSILEDGVIDDEEHKLLLAFFVDFLEYSGHHAIKEKLEIKDITISGICAVCPEIEFNKKTFCFTGKSQRVPRSQLKKVVEDAGGIFSNSLVKNIDYLIIGADANPCWAFACYGRKVEKAIQWRKEGQKLFIVHEHDFWDAVETLG